MLTIVVQPNDKILLGGGFTVVGGQSRRAVARLNEDGALDNTFAANVGGYVNTIAVQTDGKILIGGSFTTVDGQPRTNLARLNQAFKSRKRIRFSI